MKKAIILITVLLTLISINAKVFMEKILLTEGTVSDIKYKSLNLSTFFQVYDEGSAEHLIGDVYLRVANNNETIAEFYVDKDKSTKEYYTKTYKNYFLTLLIENKNKYLIVEEAKLGKPFAISNNESSLIDNIEIEITDYMHESGYNAPHKDDKSTYFDDVYYTLKVKTKDIEKDFRFYSSEIKGNYIIEFSDYNITILSDQYKHSTVLVEMIINKKNN